MRRRSPAELDLLSRRLGSDLALRFAGPSGAWEDSDLVASASRRGLADLAVTSGVDSAEQMLVNRLKTVRGELAGLGHPEYGSRHHELVGEPNVERTRQLVKLYVLEALAAEPRVQRVVSCTVYAPHDPPRDEVRIDADVVLNGEPNPRNLVVPFSLAVS